MMDPNASFDAEPSSRFCGKCGTQIKPGNNFCEKCGAPAPAEAPPLPPTRPQPPPAEFCVKCGVQLKPGDRFCGKCGAPVPPTRTTAQPVALTCSNCGSLVPAGKRFCTSCGKKLDTDETPPPGNSEFSSAFTAKIPVPVGAGVGSVFSGREYIIEQKLVALRDTFGVKDRDGNPLAYVKKKIVSWGPQFYFETPDGGRLGEMRGKVLTVRPTFEIYDAQSLVAVVKKKVLKLLGSEWWLEDGSGAEVARIKGNISEHNFSIQSPSGTEIAQINKKWVSVRDSYGIEILSEELTPYVIIAYAIAMDHAEFKAGKGLKIGPRF